MALIDRKNSRCAICEGALDRPYTATWGVPFPSWHPLWSYCDAPLHFACLEAWPPRIEFAAGYFASSRSYFAKQGTLLRETPLWLLGRGLYRNRPTYVQASLREWPFRFVAPHEHWVDYMSGPFADGITGVARGVAERLGQEILAASAELGLRSFASRR